MSADSVVAAFRFRLVFAPFFDAGAAGGGGGGGPRANASRSEALCELSFRSSCLALDPVADHSVLSS